MLVPTGLPSTHLDLVFRGTDGAFSIHGGQVRRFENIKQNFFGSTDSFAHEFAFHYVVRADTFSAYGAFGTDVDGDGAFRIPMICSFENRARFISPPASLEEVKLRGWYQFGGASHYSFSVHRRSCDNIDRNGLRLHVSNRRPRPCQRSFTLHVRSWGRKLGPTTGERINREIKRHKHVAALFPNEASLLRMVTTMVAEVIDEWEMGRDCLVVESE